jgi:hypothetical protein
MKASVSIAGSRTIPFRTLEHGPMCVTSELLLEEQTRSATLDLSSTQDGDAITKLIGLVPGARKDTEEERGQN